MRHPPSSLIVDVILVWVVIVIGIGIVKLIVIVALIVIVIVILIVMVLLVVMGFCGRPWRELRRCRVICGMPFLCVPSSEASLSSSARWTPSPSPCSKTYNTEPSCASAKRKGSIKQQARPLLFASGSKDRTVSE